MEIERKECSCCLKQKPINEFYFRKKNNRYECFCKSCTKEYKKQYYNKNKNEIAQKQKQYYLENRDKKLEYIKDYTKNNKDKIENYKKQYYQNNKQIISDKSKNYYKQNKKHIIKKVQEYFKENKEKIYNSRNKRMKNDEVYAYKMRTRKLISKAFHNKNFEQHNELEEIVGCSYNEFLFHLFYTFSDNYNMQYYDYNGKVNIDHKIPLDKANTIDDVKLLNHWSNLQLLKEEDNKKKGVNLDYEI